ncbi:hypothetical protein pb186bvf_001371 [Paramecium bursaria]
MTQIIILLSILGSVLSAYDHALGEDIFQYSRVAYCKEEILKAYDCEPCKRHPNFQNLQVFFNDSQNAQGYCGYDADKDRVVLAIRGSVDFTNYLNDLNFVKTSYDRCGGCKVHQGFYKTYENLANNLLGCAYTLNAEHPDAQIIVTGHSLGASQATFAAIEVKHLIGHLNNFNGLYLYGTPRVGDSAFATYVEKELGPTYISRVVRDRDTFTHTPTQSQGFTHFEHEIFYNDAMTSWKECGREDKACSGQYYWTWDWKKEHHLYYYGVCAGCSAAGCDNL